MRKTLSLPVPVALSLFCFVPVLNGLFRRPERKVASGYTEEENAWDIRDTVAYLKLLKLWEPETPCRFGNGRAESGPVGLLV